jgi:ubiquinone/menaquinone biosynthesis C-methylase UbiE
MSQNATDPDFYRYDATHRFAAMYPLLARQIVDDFGLTEGVCLDVGTGGAPLLIELAKLTRFSMIGLDADPEVLAIARENVGRHGLDPARFRFVEADVVSIPLEDKSVDLVLSRGSIPFWPDCVAAFREIDRVMASGGAGLVGCGFSRYQTLQEVQGMRPTWSEQGSADERNAWKEESFLPRVLSEAGLPWGKVRRDAYGVWVTMRKPR